MELIAKYRQNNPLGPKNWDCVSPATTVERNPAAISVGIPRISSGSIMIAQSFRPGYVCFGKFRFVGAPVANAPLQNAQAII
eukprot:89113-Rhodomonas_salina.1